MRSVHVNVMTFFISKALRPMRHLANTQDEAQNVVPVLEVCQRPLYSFLSMQRYKYSSNPMFVNSNKFQTFLQFVSLPSLLLA